MAEATEFTVEPDDLDCNSNIRGVSNTLEKALQEKGTTADRFIAEAKLDVLIQNYRPSNLMKRKQSDPIWSTIFRELQPTDVVYPALSGPRAAHGTTLITHVIIQNLQIFGNLGKDERRVAIDAIVGYFENIGTRFLEAPPRDQQDKAKETTYRAMSVQSLRTKLLYLFRINAFRARKKKNALKDSTNSGNIPLSKSTATNPQSGEGTQPTKCKPKKHLPGSNLQVGVGDENGGVVLPAETKRKTEESMNPERESTDQAFQGDGKTSTLSVSQNQTKSRKWPLAALFERFKSKASKFVSSTSLISLMDQTETNPLSQRDPSDGYFKRTTLSFVSFDVVLPLCENADSHFGNAILKYFCHLMGEDFLKSLESDLQFAKVVDALVAKFETYDARFLIKVCDPSSSDSNCEYYQPVDFKTLHTNLFAFIRNECQRKASKDVAEAEYNLSFDAYVKSKKIAVEDFIQGADMQVLSSLGQTKPVNVAGKEWGVVYKELSPLDVLGPESQTRQLGNALLGDAISMNADYYHSLSVRQRKVAANALVQHFEEFGSRFLEPLSSDTTEKSSLSGWRAMGYRALREKMSKLFRTQILRQHGGVTLSEDFKVKRRHHVENNSKGSKISRPLPPKKSKDKKGKRTRPVVQAASISVPSLEDPRIVKMDETLKKQGTSLDRFLSEANLEDLKNESSRSSLSQTDGVPLGTLRNLNPNDILLGHNGSSQPGNTLMELIIHRNKDYLHSLDCNGLRAAVDALISKFELCGSRFVEYCPYNGGFSVAQYRTVESILMTVIHKLISGDASAQASKKQKTAHHVSNEAIDCSRQASWRSPQVELFYQTAHLVGSKRGIFAPRPLFFQDDY